MRRFVRAVDTNGDALDAAVDDGVGDMLVDKRAVGCQRDGQAVLCGVRRDLENVGAKERFTAGEDQDRSGEFSQVADKYQRLLGGKIGFHELLAHVETAAMNAFKVAARSRLPEEEPELTVVIDCRDHGN